MTGIKRPLVQDLPYSSTPCSIEDPIEAGGVHLRAVVSPSWSSQQDNYDAGFAFAIRANVGAPCDLTGIEASTSHGRRLLVVNAGSASLTIKNESGSSTAVNRFALSADLVLAAGNSAELWYDETSTRWRAMSAPSTGGGGGGPVDAEDVGYDNTASGLTATDVQAAIDEIAAGGGGAPAECIIDLGLSVGGQHIETSNSCKTAKNTTGGGAVQVLSHQFFGGDGGKYYFEVVADNVASPVNWGAGVVTRSYAIRFSIVGGHYVGSSVNDFGLWAHGKKITAGGQTGSFPTISAGDVIGVAVDTTAGSIWWAINGTWVEGDPAAGTTPSYTDYRLKSQLHIYVTPYGLDAQCTIRGLSSEFTESIPTGFVAACD